MSGQRKCPDCGSSEIVEDCHYAQNQLVCADCGFILTEGLLTTTYTDEEHLQEVSYSRSTGQSEQQSRTLLQGIRRVRDLCKVLLLPALFEDTAVSYYQQALSHTCFNQASLEKKEILVGCCVFVTCRQHNWLLTMSTLSVLLYANKDLIAKTYLHLLKELRLDVPSLSMVNLVKTHINSFTLFDNSASVPPKFLEDKEQLVARTIQIVELASETWLVTGRHPIPVVTSAAFLAWQSLRPVGRLTCTLSQFCKIAGIDLPQPAHKRLKELHDILLQMSSQLPWLRVLKVDKRSVVKHMGDLLKHRRVLLQAAFRRVDTTDDNPESSELIAHWARETESSAAEEEAPHAGEKQACSSQRPLLLPPCILHPKKKLRGPDPVPESSAITGDESILDNEIEQYLRTPEERRLSCKAQSCL